MSWTKPRNLPLLAEASALKTKSCRLPAAPRPARIPRTAVPQGRRRAPAGLRSAPPTGGGPAAPLPVPGDSRPADGRPPPAGPRPARPGPASPPPPRLTGREAARPAEAVPGAGGLLAPRGRYSRGRLGSASWCPSGCPSPCSGSTSSGPALAAPPWGGARRTRGGRRGRAGEAAGNLRRALRAPGLRGGPAGPRGGGGRRERRKARRRRWRRGALAPAAALPSPASSAAMADKHRSVRRAERPPASSSSLPLPLASSPPRPVPPPRAQRRGTDPAAAAAGGGGGRAAGRGAAAGRGEGRASPLSRDFRQSRETVRRAVTAAARSGWRKRAAPIGGKPRRWAELPASARQRPVPASRSRYEVRRHGAAGLPRTAPAGPCTALGSRTGKVRDARGAEAGQPVPRCPRRPPLPHGAARGARPLCRL